MQTQNERARVSTGSVGGRGVRGVESLRFPSGGWPGSGRGPFPGILSCPFPPPSPRSDSSSSAGSSSSTCFAGTGPLGAPPRGSSGCPPSSDGVTGETASEGRGRSISSGRRRASGGHSSTRSSRCFGALRAMRKPARPSTLTPESRALAWQRSSGSFVPPPRIAFVEAPRSERRSSRSGINPSRSAGFKHHSRALPCIPRNPNGDSNISPAGSNGPNSGLQWEREERTSASSSHANGCSRPRLQANCHSNSFGNRSAVRACRRYVQQRSQVTPSIGNRDFEVSASSGSRRDQSACVISLTPR